jgi:hypothetical protein
MKLYGWFGLFLLIISEYCLLHRIEPFVTWFYCFAWWAYILLADNLLLKVRGWSLLHDRQREFWVMLPISVFIWLLFEAYNFVIRNWAYTIAPLQSWHRWTGYIVAFATVLPGIFITTDLVDMLIGRVSTVAASGCEQVIGRPSTKPSPLFFSLGLILTIAPLILPRYFFPAVWIGPIFLLDPIMEKTGAKSLSLDINLGNRTRIYSLLLGGFFCGLLWEFWNFWAGSRWTYTVPFFGHLKLFEMPVLGFLGFPPFALECWLLYHLIRALPRFLRFRTLRIALWIALSIVSIIILRGIDARTVLRFADQVQTQSSTGE